MSPGPEETKMGRMGNVFGCLQEKAKPQVSASVNDF
jgi:hypothetical protein